MKLKTFTLLCSILFFSTSSFSQTLVSAEHLTDYTAGQMQGSGIITAQNDVSVYKLIYNTIDAQGNPIIASGAVVVPQIAGCDSFPLINYGHGTVLRKDRVPSELYNIGAGQVFGSRKFICVMPDYIGLGESPGLHLYQHAESEATASIDMIRASRVFLEDSLNIHLNGEVFLTGYSQGGHAAMATHKYIQDNNLGNEFNVIASAPLSGAYDMSGTTADVIFSTSYSNPAYIVYVIAAYQEAYGNLFNNWSEILKPPYDTTVPPMYDGTFTIAQVNAVLPGLITDYLTDSVYNTYLADTINFSTPLRQALIDNDNYDWTPQAIVQMAYCEADEQVPFQNALLAESTMNANGAPDVEALNKGQFLDHGGCVTPAFLGAISLFDAEGSDCVTVGVDEIHPDLIGLNLYPNPSSAGIDLTYFIEDAARVKVVIYDQLGQEVLLWADEWQSGEQRLQWNGSNGNGQNVPAGIYFVSVQTDGFITTLPLVRK